MPAERHPVLISKGGSENTLRGAPVKFSVQPRPILDHSTCSDYMNRAFGRLGSCAECTPASQCSSVVEQRFRKPSVAGSIDGKSTRLNSSHFSNSYELSCLKQ